MADEDLKQIIDEIISNAEATKEDLDKFFQGNKQAGVRVRKNMQAIKTNAQTIRVGISEKNKKA